MDKKYQNNFPNKTAKYFYKISYISFLFGMPNFWIEDLHIPKAFSTIYASFNKYSNIIFFMFVPFELAGFFTQHNLTDKQELDRAMFCVSHPITLIYVVMLSRNAKMIKDWMSHLLKLKEVYNDPKLEDQMARKSILNSSAMALNYITAMTFFFVNACFQAVKYEGTFTTIVTVWPLVDDRSRSAALVRILTNIVWWLFVARVCASYTMVISLTTCMSAQYANLQSYFHSLEGIFQEDLKQNEMECKYETAFKTGIKLHSDTFICVCRIKNICRIVYSGQIVPDCLPLVILMLQMLKSERTMMNLCTTAFAAVCVLITTALIHWNAGDITIEASKVATAMYSSGWHNCRGHSSKRIRRLVVVAMSRAQKPVVLTGLGIVELSYETFLKIVKTSYSVFSVISTM